MTCTCLSKHKQLKVRVGAGPIPAGMDLRLIAMRLLDHADSAEWIGRLSQPEHSLVQHTDLVDPIDLIALLERAGAHDRPPAVGLNFYVPPSASIAGQHFDDPDLDAAIRNAQDESVRHMLLDDIERNALAGSNELLIALVRPLPQGLTYPDGSPALHVRALIVNIDANGQPLDLEALNERMTAIAVSYSLGLALRLQYAGIPIRPGRLGWELEWIDDDTVRRIYSLDEDEDGDAQVRLPS